MIDNKFLGMKFEPHTVEVEKGQLQFFARTVGENDPVYTDEAAAKAAGYRSIPVPPTYAFSLNMATPDRFKFLDIMGIDLGRVLHGEQRFEYLEPICAGDIITFESVVSDIYEKKGGALDFLTLDITATNQNGEVVVRMQNLTVVRN